MKYKKPIVKDLSQISIALGTCSGGSAVGNPKYCQSGSTNVGPCSGGGLPSPITCEVYGESAVNLCTTGHKAS